MARADHSSHTSERGARCCPQDARQQAAAAAAPSAAVASHCGGTQVEGVVVLTGGFSSQQGRLQGPTGCGKAAVPAGLPSSHAPHLTVHRSPLLLFKARAVALDSQDSIPAKPRLAP